MVQIYIRLEYKLHIDLSLCFFICIQIKRAKSNGRRKVISFQWLKGIDSNTYIFSITNIDVGVSFAVPNLPDDHPCLQQKGGKMIRRVICDAL